MPITRMIVKYGPPPKKKPEEGDTKVVKGVKYVRRRKMSNGCYVYKKWKPVFEWVKEA